MSVRNAEFPSDVSPIDERKERRRRVLLGVAFLGLALGGPFTVLLATWQVSESRESWKAQRLRQYCAVLAIASGLVTALIQWAGQKRHVLDFVTQASSLQATTLARRRRRISPPCDRFVSSSRLCEERDPDHNRHEGVSNQMKDAAGPLTIPGHHRAELHGSWFASDMRDGVEES